MIKSIAASIVILLGLAFAAAPAATAASGESAATAAPSTLTKYAWLWSDKGGVSAPRRYIPVAACTMECCCQLFTDGSMKNQCKSRDDCINAGGICRSKTDERCK